jgi:tripartite-type tricarboxylate transporter receptor subunit TctC
VDQSTTSYSASISEEAKAMKLLRRQFLRLSAGAAALPVASRIARAQAYPSRPVRLIVGFAAGGASDILARLFAPWLSERFGQQFIVDNRPGGGSNIAAEAVVRAPPDGHTLLMATNSNAVNATLYDKLTFDLNRDIAPVAGIARGHLVMLVNPSVPAKSLPEFIAYAKANPSKLSFASVGLGSAPHMAGELFKAMAGIDMVHVPYRGGAPALTDLIGGQVHLMFSNLPASEYITTGKLRALGVTTETRSEDLPTIPAIGEFVPGYEAGVWFLMVAPKNTPAEITGKLNTEINAAFADPNVKPRIAQMGAKALPGTSTEIGRLIADETEKWGKVIRAANIKPE